ncbi:NAD(P)H-binding protein [Leuconostoc suionicum]|uniref:NAD(P)H-binding protein n=1 Tax=Leuconostoc suionicum TaxID=1511761 RepID=UPI0032DFB736
MTKNILILGSSSPLGFEVVNQLLPLPEVNIIAFDRGKAGIQYPQGVCHIIGDATNEDDLKDALKNIDTVFSTLGPFSVEKFAHPVVKVMTEEGVKRLFWTTEYQIFDKIISQKDIDLAATFGFDEEIERSYVENQKLGASIIQNSNLNYTLLLAHFFEYKDRIHKIYLNSIDEEIQGGPISVVSFAKILAEMIYHDELYEYSAIKISGE